MNGFLQSSSQSNENATENAFSEWQLGQFSDQYCAPNGTVASSLCHVMDIVFKIFSILKFPQNLHQDKQYLLSREHIYKYTSPAYI